MTIHWRDGRIRDGLPENRVYSCSDWPDLGPLVEQMQYWTTVHEHLIANTQTRKPDAPRFGIPYIDGNRLDFPDHPRDGLSSGDAWAWFSIIHDRGLYTLVSSGFSRGNTHTDAPKLSSPCFEYVAKHFLFTLVASSVVHAKSLATILVPPNLQFVRRGVADGWEVVSDPDSPFFPYTDTIFRRADDPSGHRYLARSYQTEPTFYLDLDWHEISRLCADGIPGIGHIPVPGDTNQK